MLTCHVPLRLLLCSNVCLVVLQTQISDIELTVKSEKSDKVSSLSGSASQHQLLATALFLRLNENAGYQVQNQCTWRLNPLKDKYKCDLIYLLSSLQATNWCIPCSWWILRVTSTLFCFEVSITASCPYSVRSTKVTKHDSTHTQTRWSLLAAARRQDKSQSH